MMKAARRRPVYASDVRSLGGVVRVVTARDRVDGAGFYRLSFVSRGGDLTWQGPPIEDEAVAAAAGRSLADFVGAELACLT